MIDVCRSYTKHHLNDLPRNIDYDHQGTWFYKRKGVEALLSETMGIYDERIFRQDVVLKDFVS